MKNLFGFLILFSIAFISCSDDDSACPTSVWLGTYDLVSDQNCIADDGSSIDAQTSLTIIAGSAAGTLETLSTEFPFDEDNCTAFIQVFDAALTLDGDELNATIRGCSFDYERR